MHRMCFVAYIVRFTRCCGLVAGVFLSMCPTLGGGGIGGSVQKFWVGGCPNPPSCGHVVEGVYSYSLNPFSETWNRYQSELDFLGYSDDDKQLSLPLAPHMDERGGYVGCDQHGEEAVPCMVRSILCAIMLLEIVRLAATHQDAWIWYQRWVTSILGDLVNIQFTPSSDPSKYSNITNIANYQHHTEEK